MHRIVTVTRIFKLGFIKSWEPILSREMKNGISFICMPLKMPRYKADSAYTILNDKPTCGIEKPSCSVKPSLFDRNVSGKKIEHCVRQENQDV